MTSSTPRVSTRLAATSHAGARAASRLIERAVLRHKTMPSQAICRAAGDTEFATGNATARCLSVESSRRLA